MDGKQQDATCAGTLGKVKAAIMKFLGGGTPAPVKFAPAIKTPVPPPHVPIPAPSPKDEAERLIKAVKHDLEKSGLKFTIFSLGQVNLGPRLPGRCNCLVCRAERGLVERN